MLTLTQSPLVAVAGPLSSPPSLLVVAVVVSCRRRRLVVGELGCVRRATGWNTCWIHTDPPLALLDDRGRHAGEPVPAATDPGSFQNWRRIPPWALRWKQRFI